MYLKSSGNNAMADVQEVLRKINFFYTTIKDVNKLRAKFHEFEKLSMEAGKRRRKVELVFVS
jgi:hypothetical protein